MTPRVLLHTLREAGFSVALVGGRLAITPGDKLISEHRDLVRVNVPGIQHELQAEALAATLDAWRSHVHGGTCPGCDPTNRHRRCVEGRRLDDALHFFLRENRWQRQRHLWYRQVLQHVGPLQRLNV